MKIITNYGKFINENLDTPTDDVTKILDLLLDTPTDDIIELRDSIEELSNKNSKRDKQ